MTVEDRGDLEIKPSSLVMSPGGDMRRTFFNRTFSPLGKGSLRGSIFALTASAVGSGVLSLPYVLYLNGWALGLFFIFLGQSAAQISLRMLAHIACTHEIPNFSKITIKAGGKGLNLLLSIMILVFMFGACISYQIIMTSLLQYVFKQFEVTWVDVYGWPFKIIQSGFIALCILFPLSMKRDMSAFRYASLLSLASLFYTAIVLIAEMPAYYKENEPTAITSPAYLDWNIFTGASMTFYAYQCQVQMLPIHSELVNPEYRRITKVINRAILSDFSFYVVIATVGYFSSFQDTAAIVLERKRLPGQTGPDVFVLVAICGVILTIILAFPLSWNPTRQ
eukprot:CAMPEP_0170480034 /NCGR_PEP_ID=MMETSP0208-20121228/1021_1 /TAXON_ID=197538 /ORGANISM="Strombidium inclinatum, Strain S3" /LENGTH=335 /DNA_ID=CAMNT_0010752513 /DNA_START=269 /DNA_END=1276 /DNA_ORIENTATION=-